MGCISKFIKKEEFESEVEESKGKGELDVVFKKYCGYV